MTPRWSGPDSVGIYHLEDLDEIEDPAMGHLAPEASGLFVPRVSLRWGSRQVAQALALADAAAALCQHLSIPETTP